MKKKCFKCLKEKSLSEFYKHNKMADGHLNKCKECAKSDSTKYRLDNLEAVRQYDRDRGKRPERIRATNEIGKIWRAQDRRRQKAHRAVEVAIKNGSLTREKCCRCGNKKSVAHHEDYDRPLDVMWLCQPCHVQRHKEIRAEL